jgi:hypothetical protein
MTTRRLCERSAYEPAHVGSPLARLQWHQLNDTVHIADLQRVVSLQFGCGHHVAWQSQLPTLSQVNGWHIWTSKQQF